jgi:hypothetical protein
MPGVRMAKAKQKDIDKLRTWLQLNDQLAKIDPINEREWIQLKKDWEDEEDFSEIIKEISDESEWFSIENYFRYYNAHIAHIHGRIIFGFTTLLDNCADPDLDYLDFNKDIKAGFELLEIKQKSEEKKDGSNL